MARRHRPRAAPAARALCALLCAAAIAAAAALPAQLAVGGGVHSVAEPRDRDQQQQQQRDRARRPVVVGHRGASGKLPEHTAAAYDLAISEGADFIECDVQLTSDLQMICRHEQNLNETTDALDKFPGRVRTYVIDGEESTGVHAFDLTLDEIRTLRARQRFPFRDQTHNDRHPLVTFDEFLSIALAAPRVVGVYPETKHPTWHNALPQARAAGVTIQSLVVSALHARGYGSGPINSAAWGARPAYIQSFELSSLKHMAGMTQIPLVLLMGGWPGYRAADSGMTHEEMTSDAALDDAARYVSGAGPWKGSLWTVEAAAQQDGAPGNGASGGCEQPAAGAAAAAGQGLSADAAHDLSLSDTDGGRAPAQRLVSTGLVARLRARGLAVHPYTIRDEQSFVPAPLHGDVDAELAWLFDGEGVDGVFADYPGTAAAWLRRHREEADGGAAAAAGAPAAAAAAEQGRQAHSARPAAPAALPQAWDWSAAAIGRRWIAAASLFAPLVPSALDG